MINGIISAVKDCGKIILSARACQDDIEEKNGTANFVTKYDKEVQELLYEKLLALLPEAHFVGEEEENHHSIDRGYSYIVDPIDGTTNFIKDLKYSAISVGLLKDGKPYIGVVYNPYLDELFYAEKGKGAFLNGKLIKASTLPLEEGIVIFGTSPYYRELSELTFDYARKLFNLSLDLRRSGSAALDLCSIASGRAEVFFEMKLSPWDYAAAAVIIEEAGGFISTLSKEAICFNKPCSILAGGPLAYNQVPQQ